MVKSKFVNKFIFCVFLSVTLISYYHHLDLFSSGRSFGFPINLNKWSNLKYILVWMSKEYDPIKYLGEGRNTFIDRGCAFTNCYVTFNRKLLRDVADFDVILFHGPELPNEASSLPQSRSPQQKYVLAGTESSRYYSVTNKMYNNFFNWTWTYKLSSDEYFGYISIRDKEGRVIGPKEEMHWEKVEEMMPINDTLKEKLSTKDIAAAWFVSNCAALNGRYIVAKKLQIELAKYDMMLDIYGNCGTKKCAKSSMSKCLQKLETDYYFYLSFENTHADDYVTEKLMHALKHYVVPVVYGGANYTRFMPDGIYLSAETTSIEELAKQMANAIKDKKKYYDYFKWHSYYSYHEPQEASDTDPYCKLCALINNKEQFLSTSVYEDFIDWWSPQHQCD